MIIWKYPLDITDQQRIDLPKGARILSLQVQNGLPHIWVLVDPSAPVEARVFRTYGTGHQIGFDPSLIDYVGTYQIRDGALVFHVFIL